MIGHGDSPGRRSVIVSAALGAALTPLNSTMVAVALPAISADFGAAASSVTLTVVTGYLMATLVSQMPAGSIADRVGYERALTWGRWVFLAGAIAGAVAPSLSIVVVGRLLMAAGSALIGPTVMALLRVGVPAERRPRAFGTMGAVMGGAAAIGPGLGAWMVVQFGWRSLFLINLPLLAVSWLLHGGVRTVRLKPDATKPDATKPDVTRPDATPFDWLGSALIGAALVLLTLATRLSAPTAYWVLASGVVASVVLLAHERRAAAPVLDLSLFRERGFVAGALVIALQNLAMYSLLIQVPFFFGGPTGADAGLGLAIIAMTATMAVSSPIGGRLVERIGSRAVVIAGGLIGSGGVLGVMRLPPASPAFDVGVQLLLVGLGLGLSTGPSQAIALGAVPPERSGIASATVSMLRYLGAVVGTVILGYALSDRPGGPERQHLAFWIFAAAFVLSALLGSVFPARVRPAGGGARPTL